jgi:hypothetical protein
MPLGESLKADSIRNTRYLKQLGSQTNKVPCHVAMDSVAGLLISGEGNFDRPGRMGLIFLKLLQLEVRLLEAGAGCSPIVIVAHAANQGRTVPQSSTEDSKVRRRPA